MVDAELPTGAMMYNQTIFGSIGYATGAAVGSFRAGKENGRVKRGILVTGEGSLQLTVQAFADLLKHGTNPIMYVETTGANKNDFPKLIWHSFILNNNGYTIERLIHGKDAAYNKVPDWDYGALARVFGPGYPSKYYGPIRHSKI